MSGSAFGDGTLCTIRSIVSTSATSVSYFLPSLAVNFSCPILSDTSLPSFFSFVFRSFQYFLGLSVPVSNPIISIILMYHFSWFSSQ
ncbi:MAG: hypothetical protein COW24_01015 [Candidatus Kerfeldbacteria bacterium CG15_BIG_FIL_POST_REV_8_21_14_020_45_12]|uniref:Uncharacterized protein n=1 Tax=Candidatus Kerfeldbacteria bacterium CG15_BIG_FIL_POST_REV_8_21_14_020_45_12 TaxID=2014247 RepID=A0A2M7H4V7_9BACT|nr:MAG: hypothetical protein COW24_01015 [Candidatus Kerfeldbacteria bacterium CG15_BIG_FIL_POST_REV_8_21_14_020_45_12]PJA93785.1 MAG: hypothetical protein CO132_01500 [Candidatus Kerfeldbacteria bacterium CG_4_9_14_3_um_filter_45_8]